MAEHKTSNEVLVWSWEEMEARIKPTEWGFDRVGVVEKDLSDTLGFSFIRKADGSRNSWLLRYDEVMYVIKGTEIIHHEGKRYEVNPGGAIFLRRGTQVIYESKGDTLVLCCVYPTWWGEQQG
jgi:ethanolamine utilization protein EutQ (cupin superfamily)